MDKLFIRDQLETRYKQWISDYKLIDCTTNLITFLISNDLLDTKKFHQFIEMKEVINSCTYGVELYKEK